MAFKRSGVRLPLAPPSSGPVNLAAAGGTDAFGLFGSTLVLTYSKFIHAIVPHGGPSPGGMTRIAPTDVN